MNNKVNLKSKIMYGCGDIYGGGAFLVISLLFLNYLTDIIGLKPALGGLIFFVGKAWDAVSDPLMGMLSDRTKSKFGRRRVYFAAGIIPIFFSFAFLWYSFGIKSQTGLFIYYLTAYIIFNTIFTMVMIPYSAIVADMTNDYKERTSLSGFRISFSVFSAILAGVVPKLIVNTFGSNIKYGYLVMGLIFGIFYAIPWIFVFLGTWENPSHIGTVDESFNIIREIKAALKNKSFRIHAGMFVCGQTAVDFLTTIFIYYLTYCLNIANKFSVVLGSLLVTQLLVMPLNIKISKKFGKTAPFKTGLCIWIAGLLLSLFLKPGTSLIFVILVAVLCGFGTSVSVFVPWSILPEVADVDEMISSKRREGVYSGMATFLRKLAQATSVFVIGIVLQLIGYVAPTDPKVPVVQAPGTVLGIKLLFVVAPILFITLAIYFSTKYSMTEKKYNILMQEIARRKNGGSAEKVEDPVKEVCEELTGYEYKKLWNGTNISTGM